MSLTKQFLEGLPGMLDQKPPGYPEPTGGICYESKTEPTNRWVYLDQLIQSVDEKLKWLDERDANGHSMWNEFKVFLLQQSAHNVPHNLVASAIINSIGKPIMLCDEEKFRDFVKRKYTTGSPKPKDVLSHWNNYKAKSK